MEPFALYGNKIASQLFVSTQFWSISQYCFPGHLIFHVKYVEEALSCTNTSSFLCVSSKSVQMNNEKRKVKGRKRMEPTFSLDFVGQNPFVETNLDSRPFPGSHHQHQHHQWWCHWSSMMMPLMIKNQERGIASTSTQIDDRLSPANITVLQGDRDHMIISSSRSSRWHIFFFKSTSSPEYHHRNHL